MNSEGKIKAFKDFEDARERGDFNIPVDHKEMTAKQFKRLQSELQPVVSIKDHRSILGKKLTSHNNMTKNQLKRQRRNLRTAKF